MRVERIALALILAVQIPNQAGKEYPKTIKRNLRRIRVLEKTHVLVLLDANINSKVNRSKKSRSKTVSSARQFGKP
jgi:hypothetical protein